MSRPAATRAAAWTLALAAALACTSAGQGAASIALRAPRFLVQGQDLTIVVEQRRALAGHRVSFLVFLDGRLVDHADGDGGTSRIRISSAQLEVGAHDIVVKTGSERSTVRVRVVAAMVPLGVAALALLAGAMVARRLRKPLGT